MKKTISLILLVLVVLACVGCSDAEEHTVITTPKPTIAPSTNATTAPTTSPTKPTTKAPTIHEHPEPGKNEDDLEYTPEDIPEVYWAVLNNREAIYFPEGCTDCTYGPCYAWLDDYVFLTGHQEIATADYVGYTVIDMDGDGNEELVLQHGDLLVLHEKDGRVYGYQFGFRQMELRSDGTHIWSRSAGFEQGVSRIRFLEDHTCQIIDICWVVYDSKDPDTVEYYIGSNQVTQQEYEDCFSKLSQTMPESGKLGRYPIRDKNEEDLTPPGG